MPEKSKSSLDQSDIVQIKVMGHLDSQWSDWFDNMTITPSKDGTTLLTGPVIDDAALHGLLKIVRDSGMRLLSVNHIEPDETEAADTDCTEGDKND
jgi:hypothetical protein